MISYAYAADRSDIVETQIVRARTGQGTVSGRARTVSTGGFELSKRLTMGLLSLVLLALIGWGAARLMDSALLGFVLADLMFLVGIALRGVVAPQRSRAS